MAKKPKIINRGRVKYVIYEDRILVEHNGQWTSYNPYENWNRAGITSFINAIIKSKADEYNTAADYMTLAYQCGIRGIGTQKPKDIDENSISGELRG
jgi:hypothetical protein